MEHIRAISRPTPRIAPARKPPAAARAARATIVRGLVAASLATALVAGSAVTVAAAAITIRNACTFPIWIDQTPNTGFRTLPGSNPNPAGRLDAGQSSTFQIPAQ